MSWQVSDDQLSQCHLGRCVTFLLYLLPCLHGLSAEPTRYGATSSELHGLDEHARIKINKIEPQSAIPSRGRCVFQSQHTARMIPSTTFNSRLTDVSRHERV